MKETPNLPPNFRKLSVSERQSIISGLFNLSQRELSAISGKLDLSDLSDVLIEGSVGTFPVPFGLASGFLIDGEHFAVPMATEEPSVIIAASHGAMLVKAGGGFHTSASLPIMTAQIFLKNSPAGAIAKILSSEMAIRQIVNDLLPGMIKRGGGFYGLEAETLSELPLLLVQVHIDVRDAMGANIVNTVAEKMKSYLFELTGCKALMAVLTNASLKRQAKASFSIPEKFLRKAPFSGEEVCRSIVLANELAKHCPTRAVTHNKGIMNGISALALATGNDTRAIEAAAHYFAQTQGKYFPLTSYDYSEGHLSATLELPLPLGTVGGSISIWPASEISMKILNRPDSQKLCRIAAAVGLAQNLSALFALVTEGIQEGHMKLHAAKLAYAAGARGAKARILASKLWRNKTLDEESALALLGKMKG